MTRRAKRTNSKKVSTLVYFAWPKKRKETQRDTGGRWRWWRRNKYVCINKMILFFSLFKSNLECALNWPVCLTVVATSTWYEAMKKNIWQTITLAHATSCICEILQWNLTVSFTFLDFFFDFLFRLDFFALLLYLSFRHHSAPGGYYNINKTPYENQVLNRFFFAVAVVVMMKLWMSLTF